MAESFGGRIEMHTAGPWEAPRNGLDGAIYAPNAPKGTLWRICDAVRGQSDEELSANARLIAAAPDLLAALKEAANELWSIPIASTHVLNKVRAAIAKAEGQE